jgi:hypothetical protein
MRTIRPEIIGKICVAIVSVFIIAACTDSGSSKSNYKVTMTNLTSNQPLSPQGVVLHTGEYLAWQVGEQAAAGIERLAEAGDPAVFLDQAEMDANVLVTAQNGSVIIPGSSISVEIKSKRDSDLRMSVATMLVNTNDAYTGLTGTLIGDLAVNESKTVYAPAYDAGTEANSETAATVPGPAGNGEGYNPVQDDRGFITVHSGAVTADDGLAGSSLNESHRWDNPVTRIIVTRIK